MVDKLFRVVLPHTDAVQCENDQIQSHIVTQIGLAQTQNWMLEQKLFSQLIHEFLFNRSIFILFGQCCLVVFAHRVVKAFIQELISRTKEKQILAKCAQHDRIVAGESGVIDDTRCDKIAIGRNFQVLIGLELVVEQNVTFKELVKHVSCLAFYFKFKKERFKTWISACTQDCAKLTSWFPHCSCLQ